LSSSTNAVRYTREPWTTSEAAASSQRGEKPKAAIDPSSTTFPAALRFVISLAETSGGSLGSTRPTASMAIRKAFFAVAS